MVAPSSTLDRAFLALANPTRRAVVERLREGSASVSELAEPFDMALPSFMQHLGILEESGLVASQKRGRVRTVRLRPAGLQAAGHWLADQMNAWEQRLDQLDDYLERMEDPE